MSTADASAYDAAVSTVYGIQVSRFCSLAAVSILCYEFLATISVEIEVFWPHVTLSFASVLFMFNRYLVLLGAVPIIIEFFGNIGESWSVLGADETSDDTITPFPLHACDLSLTANQGERLIAPWAVVMVFDTTVFVLTVAKGICSRGLLRTSIFRVFLRDGAAYYGIMVVMNIVNIVTILPFLPPEQRGLLLTLCNVLSSILMTRLMFNLRDFNSRRTGGRDVNQGVSDNDTELTDSTLWGHNQVSTGPSVYFLDDGV
ncbi:hypothetical protein CERSUDRAFT_95606 [Gelatoporia subvermispora B]|uniref:DUF6533 domain-containing protein n=1 Tax=Ceriporiopsis subvermispora (strain B) TaxID=914234 RepID=M2PJ82_CERS8|nr:hypothetical protein CERSUDRAFT_95606 [Gelatoporia subvermispora B]